MHSFHYRNGVLYCENVPIQSLVKQHGTPLYVYSHQTIESHFQKLDSALTALDHGICFSPKANSNAAVLRTLANLGSGFDLVSEGELRRVIAAGGDPRKCVFAGVAKSEREIEFALRKNIYCFNAESEPELERINRVASRLNKKASVAVRVNPDVDAHTHAKVTTGTYENKFGIQFELVEKVYARASRMKNLRLLGVQMHIGSQITSARPFELAVQKVLSLAERLKAKYGIEFFSVGGGLGIVYQDALASGPSDWWTTPTGRKILTPEGFAQKLVPLLKPLGLKILVEPGRYIVGNAGILVTRVEYVKKTGTKTFVIVDAAMNDLIRPAFYDSYHQIVLLKNKRGALIPSDVVGGICESGDYFCKDRPLPKVGEGEHLAFLSAGAYGSTMCSNYNSRGILAEVMVSGSKSALVRQRQPLEQIWQGEKIPAWLR